MRQEYLESVPPRLRSRAAALDIRPWNGRLLWRMLDPPQQALHQFSGAAVEHVLRPAHDVREVNYTSGRSILMYGIRWVNEDTEVDVGGLRMRLFDVSGKLGFYPAGTGMRGHLVPAAPQSYLCVHFKSVAGLVEPGLDDRDLGLEPDPVFDSDVLVSLCRALLAGLDEPAAYGRLFGDTVVTALAIELARRRLAGRVPLARGGLSRRQARLVLDYIEAHLAEDVTLPELAALAGLSPWHFNRAFKQTFGLPPYRWLASRRIERAKLLLADVTLPIQEVAVACGFGGVSQFSRRFKLATGLPPGAFRRALL